MQKRQKERKKKEKRKEQESAEAFSGLIIIQKKKDLHSGHILPST